MKIVPFLLYPTFFIILQHILSSYAIPVDRRNGNSTSASCSSTPIPRVSGKKNIDDRDPSGYNAIYHAVKENTAETAAQLAELGADLGQVYGRYSVTLLQVALEYGSSRAMDWLITRDVSAKPSLLGGGVDARDSHGQNAIYYAVKEDATDTSAALTNLGADLNQVYNNKSLTLLHVAAEHGSVQTTRWLIGRGVCVNALDGDLWTPLHYAADRGQLSVLKQLLESGACIDCKSLVQWTALHYAVLRGGLSEVKQLIESGGCINCTDFRDWTPLHWAAYKGHVPVVKLLIEKGACVSCKDHRGWTPLHWAAAKGSLPMAQLLVEGGACINCVTDDAETPLHWARLWGQTAVVEYLKAKGGAK